MARQSPSPVSSLRKKRNLLAFGWYGGKYSHLDWLLPLLPRTDRYCEPFAGSGAVLINREPSPVETYNDLDGEVCNFFRQLRDDGPKLVEALNLTPFSREEFATACELDPNLDGFERARRFFVRARQVRTGLAQKASLGRWANCKGTSRSGMAGVVSRWIFGIPRLAEISERLLRVQIENRPALEIIRIYDSPDTLFYCDPPYVHSTRGDNKAYHSEMTDEDHRDLASALNQIEGLAAISGYDCDLMQEIFPEPRWRKIVGPERAIHSVKQTRTECLWLNYSADLLESKSFF